MSSDGLVRRYYVYRATLSVGFVTPVFTLFLLRTLSFAQVGALSALYALLSVAGEVPTGYVADRFGRRTSLLLSVGASVASLAGFVVAQSFRWYLLLYALWALALTLRSGSIDAWLYDLLDARLDAGDFSRVRGRGDAVQRWTSAVAMIAGGLLYGVEPTYPFLAAVAFNGLGFLALLSLPRSPRPGGAARPDPRAVLSLLRERLARPPLRALVAYVGLFYAAVGVANGYVQPMAIETLGPLAARAGVSLPPGGAMAAARAGEAGPTLALALGVLYAALAALSSVGGYYAGAIEARLGVRGALFVAPLATAVALVVPVRLAAFALPVFVALRTANPVVEPIATGYVNDHAGGAGRATLLSAVTMLSMTVRVPLALGAGLLAEATNATTAVAALGATFLLLGGAVWAVGDVAPG